MPRAKIRARFLAPIARFAEHEAQSGILLMVCAAVALVAANSPLAGGFAEFWQTKLSLGIGAGFKLDKPFLLWINDGLMAVFFVLVGLEIKREVLLGELSSAKKAALPLVAALGGMVVPALIFRVLNPAEPSARGWGIPMATDIAFALGVLALLGSRVPFALKVFLTAVAIVDDLGAVLVIALFYTAKIDVTMLGLAGVVLLGLVGLNRLGTRSFAPYLVLGVMLWVCFLKSGVHATIAGVLFALTIPVRVYLSPRRFSNEAQEALDEFDRHLADPDADQSVLLSEGSQTAVHELEQACEKVQMPLSRMMHSLHPWVSLMIVPIFALANAGVGLNGAGASLGATAAQGVIFGLLLGKPLGIFCFSWLAVRFKLCSLPEGVSWRQIFGLGVLAGIGFTMSLFIAELAFTEESLLHTAKIGILAGSLLAGVLGYLILRSQAPKTA